MSQKITDKFILDAPCSVIETRFVRFMIENSGQNLFNGHIYNSITLIDENIKVTNIISGDIFLFEKRKTFICLRYRKFIFLGELKNNKFSSFEIISL